MSVWVPTVHFEGVEEGATLRGEIELPPVLRRDALEVAGLAPSGQPASFVVGAARSTDRGQVIGRAGTAIVETPFEGDGNGELLLVRFEDGVRAVFPDRERGGSNRTVFALPVSPGPEGNRGVFGTAGRWLLQKVVFPLVDPVLGRISDGFVGAWESSRRPHRVRFYTPDDYRNAGTRPAEPRDLRPGRVLLLVHGTNSLSHSMSGLGALPPTLVHDLFDQYERQVIAFDHPTLATDPVENAQRLAEWLREVSTEVEIDVLCHSRGGLVARLLVERAGEVGLDLGKLPIRFRSLNFVATPHRGTPLADAAHLGGFVDRLLTLTAPIPDNPVTVALEGALTVARQLAAGFFGGLDGVSCMRPPGAPEAEAPAWLAKLEDGRGRPPDVCYRAIAGDFEPPAGSGLWHSVKDAGVDVVFGGLPNDVVVPTLSALSLGAEPGSGFDDMVVFDETDGVMHSGYFGADLVQPVLRAWLRRLPESLPAASRRRELDADGVRSIAEIGPEWSLAKALDLIYVAPVALRPALQQLVEQAGARLWSVAAGRGATPTPAVVVLVPGIMGSELAIGADRLWLSPWRLAQGAFQRLRLPATDESDAAVPADLLCAGYRVAIDRLTRRYHVVAFPYDWRDDIDLAAGRLRTLLDALLADPETSGVPVHVVAHSMGGLVTRRALDAPPAPDGADTEAAASSLLDRLAASGGRIVLAGTPNHGSIATPLALIGRHPVMSWLARVDPRASLADWLDVVWTFPGILQLLPAPTLPSHSEGGDPLIWLYEPKRWRGRDRARTRAALQAAIALHEHLQASDGTGLHLILGDGVSTPVGMRAIGTDSFEVAIADSGDGTVAVRCGELAGAVTYLAPGVEHGNLLRDARGLQAIIDILERGTTKLLPTPSTARGKEAAVASQPALDWLSVTDAEQRLTGAAAVGRDAAAVAPPQVWSRRDALAVGLDALAPFLGTASSRLPPLRIRVVHGGIECAGHAILVGHATGTPIEGAEGRCDDLLGSQLSNLQILGLYPDTPGTFRFVARRTPTDRIDGCIVLGLDSSEPLSRGVLSDLVTRAVLDYADRIDAEWAAERARAPGGAAESVETATPLGISAVAAGCSSAFGLAIERSVTAIAQGVQRANEVLAKVERPVVEQLEFVDRYAGQVERIRWAIDRMVARRSTAPGGEQVLVLEGDVVESPGRREGAPPPEYESGRWEHLSIDAENVGPDPDDNERHLTYRFARNRAAASETPRRIDRAVVFGILHDAVTQPQLSVELGRVLYEELLPVEVKDELSRTDNLVLQVDEKTADLPWELFGDRVSGDEPLACRVGLLRQLRHQALRARPSGSIPNTALVIGDPPTDLRPLPNARAEARDVASLLHGAQMDVTLVDFPDGTTGSTATANRIRRAFWARDHRVVHIAAHGLYRMRGGDGSVQGGVVIGPKTFLTADDFDNLRATPDLVFLNCCHLGQIRTGLDAAEGGILDPVDQQVAAAGLASALMRIGVKAVVVAGWQVDDQIASRFAGEFYRRLLEGLPYGEAVKQARMACFAAGNGRDNTWAAYQCYGDPAFRLWRQVDGDRGEMSEITMRSVALRSLEDLRTNSEEAADHLSLRNEVAALDEQVTARWADDGELLDRVAATWASIGDYERAIERFEAAIAARLASAPLSAVELLADLCSRRALELHRTGRDGAEVEAFLERADHWMRVLVALGRDTRERHVLDGGSFERLAVLRPDQRDLYIQRAIAAYVDAAKDDPHDLGGFRTAIQLAAVNGGGRGTSLEDVLSTGDRVARWTTDIVEPVEGGAHFAERVGHADSKLTAALIDGKSELGARLLALLADDGDPAAISTVIELIETDLSSQVDALAGAYAGVRAGGFPNLGWRGVVEHIADLADLTAAAELSAADPMRRLLGRLEGLGQ